MASDPKAVAATRESELGRMAADWLDPFAADDAAVAGVAVDAEARIPFADWCLVPVALAFVLGDMAWQFLR